MPLKITSPATNYPVSVDDLKDHLRIISTGEEILLKQYIIAATKMAENLMKRQLCTATYQLTLSSFATAIELPRPPLHESSALSITYVDTSGATQTCPTTCYTVDDTIEPAVLRLAYESTWPETRQIPNAVRISFKAGYPQSSADDEQSSCPEDIKLWIQMRAGAWYENRESVTLAQAAITTPPREIVDGLLDDYLIHNIGGL